jgi:hypothetical protein
MGSGDQSGTWGTTTNTNLGTLIEAAIAGRAAVSMTDADYTLTTANGTADEARNMILNISGALTATRNVICPAVSKLYVVRNATTGGQSIILKTSAGSGVTIESGLTTIVFCDGTNVVEGITRFPLTNPTIAGNALFSSAGARIQGDFSNATLANRTAFQDKTTNGVTGVNILPNGTAAESAVTCFNNSDPTNASYGGINCNATAVRLTSANTGSGSALPLVFVVGAGGPEVARFDTAGRFVVGGNTAIQNNSTFYGNSGAGQLTLRNTAATAGKYWYFGPDSANNVLLYRNDGTGAYIVDGGTSWTANSDERLKTDLVPIQNAAAKVDSLRAVTGRYLTDNTGTSRSFLIAQDVQAVLPEAVKNNAQGYLGLSYTEVVPLLVAAIKELSARVAALEAK